MKHYKIVKKTFYGINHHAELTEKSKFKCYQKIGWFWFRMNAYSMSPSGSTFSCEDEVAFDTIEQAERFIRMYHLASNKIGKYTIETIKKIDLE